jgi:hypothetical protein
MLVLLLLQEAWHQWEEMNKDIEICMAAGTCDMAEDETAPNPPPHGGPMP